MGIETTRRYPDASRCADGDIFELEVHPTVITLQTKCGRYINPTYVMALTWRSLKMLLTCTHLAIDVIVTALGPIMVHGIFAA